MATQLFKTTRKLRGYYPGGGSGIIPAGSIVSQAPGYPGGEMVDYQELRAIVQPHCLLPIPGSAEPESA